LTDDKARIRRRILLTIPLWLILGEAVSRIWVAVKYTPERIEQLTTHSPVRGRFASHPYLPFLLNPDFPGHNPLGFRGDPFPAEKPAGVHRIVCCGASTTYGSLVDPHDSYPAELGRLMAARADHWEVINAGVPGWTSAEILVNFDLRVLPLSPDIVVILPPRNEIFPQTYNNFKPDYTHFRRAGFNFTVSNFVHKQLFRWSRLFMLACTVRGERFGWSETAEHPLYGGMVWENRPTPEDVERNLKDPARMLPFRHNLEELIQLCKPRGIRVLVCTMPIRPEKLALDELDRDSKLDTVIGGLVERDNDIARDVAKRLGAVLVDTAKLSERADLFLDDSHLIAEGHRLQARMIYDVLAPLIEPH
jgi:lysophospholipase L1-like esterase